MPRNQTRNRTHATTRPGRVPADVVAADPDRYGTTSRPVDTGAFDLSREWQNDPDSMPDVNVAAPGWDKQPEYEPSWGYDATGRPVADVDG